MNLEIRCAYDMVLGRTSVMRESFNTGRVDLDAAKLRGRPETLLRRMDVQKETPELKAQYLVWSKALEEVVSRGPGVAGTITGTVKYATNVGGRSTEKPVRRRYVITDQADNHFPSLPVDDPRMGAEPLMPGSPTFSRVPVRLLIEAFDPTMDESLAAHISHFDEHQYDPGLADSLVLPPAHRKLLDVLVSDPDRHVADLVEGRTTGNWVLAAGRPGTGKTLTAHAYSETLHKPLYAVGAAVILAKGDNRVRGVLTDIFERCRRWGAILLLDEVDVIVAQRGADIARNSLTAAFLRMAESYEGLAFMATNRQEDVDDAVLSRCAAILNYTAPTGELAEKAWRVHAGIHNLRLDDQLAADLARTLPEASPRDMRQLLRLAVQTSQHEDRPIDLDLFHEVAQYRGLTPRQERARR